MANKKAKQKTKVKGPIIGIGDVVGSNSKSNVEINFFSKNNIIFGEKTTVLQRNPNFTAEIDNAFFSHPDAIYPELDHLIGHLAELSRLTELYDYVVRQNKETFVFLTGQYGYGTKAMGRTFVDAVRQDQKSTAITRFWPEKNEERLRRDVRWNLGFQRRKEVFDLSPKFLKQESMIPFWALFFQICEQIPWMENEPLPTKLVDLPAYFRNCTKLGKPLVLLLEDFEFASSDWHKLIRYLAKEVDHVLPILWIITMHSDNPLDVIAEETRSPAQLLALELAGNNIAEIYYISRVTKKDIENYIAPAESAVADRLFSLTNGVPSLVQNLWRDWRRTTTVFQNDKNLWELDKKSRWAEYGSGRDYIHSILDQLWPLEDEAPWPAERMYVMLTLAAQEGASFTVDALAKAFDVESKKLIFGLEYLLDEPDDPGLVKEVAPITLELKTANWKHTLERFQFSPMLIWYSLIGYDKPDTDHLIRYAEGLRSSMWPFVEQVAAKIAYLYEQANQPELAKKYRQITNENNDLRKMMFQAELLLEFPDNELVYSRLYEFAYNLYVNFVSSDFPIWSIDFASRLVVFFGKSNSQSYLDIPYLLLARSNLILSEYKVAREYFEKTLAIEKDMKLNFWITDALIGLGDVSRSLGEYQFAREYYKETLTIEKDLENEAGIGIALSRLGDVSKCLGEYPAAREYFKQALCVAKKLRANDGIAIVFYGLGELMLSLGKCHVARRYFKKALTIEEELDRKPGIANALNGLGEVARCMEDYQVAREYYLRQLSINEELERKEGIANAHWGLGDVARSLREYEEARIYYERASDIYQRIGSPNTRSVKESIEKLNELTRSGHESKA